MKQANQICIVSAHQNKQITSETNITPQIELLLGQHSLRKGEPSVKIDMHQKGDGPLCMLHDWTTVHWKAYEGDRLVEDSRTWAENNGTPKVFRLGHYEVSKCWDIAI